MEFFGGEALFSQTSSGVKPYSSGEAHFFWKSSGVNAILADLQG